MDKDTIEDDSFVITPQRRTIYILVAQARGLINRSKRPPDPVAILTVDEIPSIATRTCSRTLNPEWFEGYKIDITETTVVSLSIYDHFLLHGQSITDDSRRMAFLGQAIVFQGLHAFGAPGRAEALTLGMTQQFTLQASIYHGSLNVKGTLTVRISSEPMDFPPDRPAFCNEDRQGILPSGWAKQITPFLDTYYLDHNSQTTTWERPRLETSIVPEPIPDPEPNSRSSTPLSFGEIDRNDLPHQYTTSLLRGKASGLELPHYSATSETADPREALSTPLVSNDFSSPFRWVNFISTSDKGPSCRYRQRGERPDALGGFSDVFLSDVRYSDGSTSKVAVKKLRAVMMRPGSEASDAERKLLKRLNREVRVWSTLRHPNIAPLVGFNFDQEVAVISPWYNNGNVRLYLERNPERDRLRLLVGIATGLDYLHTRTPVVVHGDLKPDNVLIDDAGNPIIIDFGLSTAIEDEVSGTAASLTSVRSAGNTRWIAPEILMEEGSSKSVYSDVYAWGCVALEIASGEPPYPNVGEVQLMYAIFQGKKPVRDRAMCPMLHAGSPLWDILDHTWNPLPTERPSMRNVCGGLRSMTPESLSSDASPGGFTMTTT